VGPQTTFRRIGFGPVALAALGMVVALLGSAAVGSWSGRLATGAVSTLRATGVGRFDFTDKTTQVATDTFVNTGDLPVTITGVSASTTGLATSLWQVVPGNEDCRGAVLLPVVGYCVVTLRFNTIGKPVDGTVLVTAGDGTTAQSSLTTSNQGFGSPGVNPLSIDFGNVTVAATSPAHQVTVNASTDFSTFEMMSVTTVDTPAAPGRSADYQPATDACTGKVLSQEPFVPECLIGETATPAAAGKRPAFLDITYCDTTEFDFGPPPGGGSNEPQPPPSVPAGQELVCGHGDGFLLYASHMLVSLTSTGVAVPPSSFTPTLVASPPLAPAGRTTEVTGTGFPVNATVTFALVPIGTAPTTNLNIVPGVRTTTTNGIGAFTNQIMVLMPHTAIGGYEILATATTVNATTPFLITPGTEQPPKFVDRH
jgi:hypothetical protein